MVFSFKISAKETPTIIWKNFDFPPVSIINGAQKDQGYADILQNYIIKKLPQYTHKREVSNIQRTVMETKKFPNICSPSLLKTTERQTYLEYSTEAYTIFPVGAIILTSELAEFRPYIDANGILDLDKLLASEKFSIGLMTHRAYGGATQNVIEKYKQSSLAQSYIMSDLLESLFKILTYAKRIDLILGYPVEMVYLANKLKLDLDSVTFVNINPAEQMITGYIGCSKSPAGVKIISDINTILNKGGRKVALNAYAKWLDPKTRDDYRQRLSSRQK